MDAGRVEEDGIMRPAAAVSAVAAQFATLPVRVLALRGYVRQLPRRLVRTGPSREAG